MGEFREWMLLNLFDNNKAIEPMEWFVDTTKFTKGVCSPTSFHFQVILLPRMLVLPKLHRK